LLFCLISSLFTLCVELNEIDQTITSYVAHSVLCDIKITMIEVPKGKSDEPGTWNVIEYPRARRVQWCEFTCPNGHGASITKSIHAIAQDGTVNPSVICPRQGCTFHEFVRLISWKPEYADEQSTEAV
jgi:hypothetical protein